MARPLDKRPFGETQRDCWTTFARVAHDPIPHDSKRLRKLVRALVQRIENSDPIEGCYLRNLLHWLAGSEERFRLYSAEEYAGESVQRQALMRQSDRLARKLVASVER